MIKHASIKAISFYQIFISILLRSLLGTSSSCRFDETCSDYAKRAIAEKGVMRGSFFGFVRILKCNPLTS